MCATVITTDNPYGLELTVCSLLRRTRYPCLNLVIVDNGFKPENSVRARNRVTEFGTAYMRSEHQRAHAEWLDILASSIREEYWLSLHDDLWFLAPDPIIVALRTLRSSRGFFLLCQPCRKKQTVLDPYGNLVNVGETMYTHFILAELDHLKTVEQSSLSFPKEMQ